MIRSYLSGIINDHKTQEERKIHLAITITFISSKGSDQTRMMHSKSYNKEIIIGNVTYEIIEELFETLLQRYPERLEESMKGSEFILDSIDILY